MDFNSSGKVQLRGLRPSERKTIRADLLRALEYIRREADFPLFLDLLTEAEQVMLSRRIRIAKQLLTGASVREIQAVMNTGQSTIESVHRWLQKRCMEYRETFPTLYVMIKEDAKRRRSAEPIIPFSFRWLRRKYPLHFLIFNMLINDFDWDSKNSLPRAQPYRPRRRGKYKRL